MDKAAPVVLAAITQDTDSNGKVDHLEVLFSEAIDDSEINNNIDPDTDYWPETLGIANVSNEKIDATEGTCANDAAEDDAYHAMSEDEMQNELDRVETEEGNDPKL